MKQYNERNVLVFDYNLAYFYIRNNVDPVRIDKHYQTKKIFFVFEREKTQQLYEEWKRTDN